MIEASYQALLQIFHCFASVVVTLPLVEVLTAFVQIVTREEILRRVARKA